MGPQNLERIRKQAADWLREEVEGGEVVGWKTGHDLVTRY